MVSALVLVVLVIFMGCVIIKSVIFLKLLVMLVYLSGVVVFILYVSCTCVDTMSNSLSMGLLVLLFGVVMEVLEKGVVLGIDSFWGFDSIYMFLLVAWLFNMLVMVYMFGLFKISGSLRF